MNRPKVFDTVTADGYTTSPLDDVPEPIAPSDTYRDEMKVLTVTEPQPEAEELASVSILVSQATYDEYRRVAAAQNQSVEEVMAARLNACKSHNALRGLWFSDSDRVKLENLIQKWPLETASQALSLLSRAASVRIDDIEVILSPAQKRVVSLAMFGGRTPKTFFESMIKRELRV